MNLSRCKIVGKGDDTVILEETIKHVIRVDKIRDEIKKIDARLAELKPIAVDEKWPDEAKAFYEERRAMMGSEIDALKGRRSQLSEILSLVEKDEYNI